MVAVTEYASQQPAVRQIKFVNSPIKKEASSLVTVLGHIFFIICEEWLIVFFLLRSAEKPRRLYAQYFIICHYCMIYDVV